VGPFVPFKGRGAGSDIAQYEDWRPASHALLAAMLVFVLAAAGLSIAHREDAPHYRLSAPAAIAAARGDSSDARFLRNHPFTSVRVIPYDATRQAVSFFAGARILLFTVVGPRGHVVGRQEHPSYAPQVGAPLANEWWFLALLSGAFLISTMVVPLRRMRNLDALALAGFAANIVAVNASFLALSVLLSVPLLAYLAIRCLLAGARAPRPYARRSEQVPLIEWLARGVDGAHALRLLRITTIAALAAFLIITLTSIGESTNAAASLTGATDLLHWQSPYGHITGVLHGGTYPLLNYVFFLPGAVLTPVSGAFSDLSGALVVSAAAGLLTAAAIWVLARRSLGADRLTSTRAVLAWLLFPPVLVTASGATGDVVVAACLAWTFVFVTSASRSLLLLTVAVWTKLVPLVLVPLWLVRAERPRRRALVPALALSFALCAYLVGLGGVGALKTMLVEISFPFRRGSLYAPWQTFSLEWLQPLVEAAVLALLVWVVLRVRRVPSIWKDPVRMAGLFGALLLGVQLCASQWTYTYLPWVFPFVLFALMLDTAPDAAAPGVHEPAVAVAPHPDVSERELQVA
jgi:hypothetical protein